MVFGGDKLEIGCYLNLSKNYISEVIDKNLSENYLEFNKSNFPLSKGVYFVYEKGDKNLVYIGSATNSFKKRCSQYISSSNCSFRRKIIKHVLKKSLVKKKKEKSLEEKDINKEAVQYIKDNYYLKFLPVDTKTTYSDILLLERACISLKNPKFNDKYEY